MASWAGRLAAGELAAFARARRRFTTHPSPSRLHDLRVCARRLISLDQDLGALVDLRGMHRLHRFVALTGETRDASVVRDLLRAVRAHSERVAVRPLLRELRARERTGMRRIRRIAAQIRVRLA